ncbi:MAG: zinc metallopeptidase [Planctomycetes bacterium]|nr:zinc metallopeptidase [Planctomycetota bacterium]MCB9908766.1 zinc metallopeptidase [Planctomycetota bacterium]MCB9912409.1 zinc metallopeptidase [Planctomycetota bacterium]HPF15296.1 zinc metallopeptidase [Planctomycetota bacterium]HRV81768.1 zinc metallopeptidase [Planctomycetota bacterium]
MPFFDPKYFLFVGPGLLLAMWASWRVKSTFARFSRVGVRSGMTGAEAAAAVARAGGAEVQIERVQGFLSDHYDPRTRTLRLSPDVYDGRSVSAIAVAAHEAGHAIQHVKRYPWLGIRSMIVPAVQIGSNAWIWIFMAGMLLQLTALAWLGVLLFGLTVVFQLVTLPTEFDASNRAKQVLVQAGIVTTPEEEAGVSKVLGAAAMTYVAGAITAILTLLYYVSLLSGRSNR